MTFALHSSLRGLSTNYVIYSCSMWKMHKPNSVRFIAKINRSVIRFGLF